MGFNLGFEYKWLDCWVYVFFFIGNDMVCNYEWVLFDVNCLDYYLDCWIGEGISIEVLCVIIVVIFNLVFFDFFVEDVLFVCLQNVQLGYIMLFFFLCNDLFMLCFYVSVNNLLMFMQYCGFDFVVLFGVLIGGGIDYGFYFIFCIFMVGVNFNL